MRKYWLLLICLLIFAGCAAALAPKAECATTAQAGTVDFAIEGGHEIVMVVFTKEFCKLPVVVATGNEGVDQVQIGVVTPKSVSFVVSGPDASARVYWHALPGE